LPATPPLDPATITAIFLLYIGLIPNNISTGLTSLYYAFERAETPAAVTTVATICKTVFGLVALLLGWGSIGLAAVSILTNLITLAILWWNGRDMLAQTGEKRALSIDSSVIRRMTSESDTMMLNHFLATIFFQIEIVLIEVFHGSGMVGLYS